MADKPKDADPKKAAATAAPAREDAVVVTAPPDPGLLHDLVHALRAAAGVAPAPDAQQVAPPPSTETVPGGKFKVGGRYVFSNGQPYSEAAPPPLHDPINFGIAPTPLAPTPANSGPLPPPAQGPVTAPAVLAGPAGPVAAPAVHAPAQRPPAPPAAPAQGPAGGL
jgi:hypothetical protein